MDELIETIDVKGNEFTLNAGQGLHIGAGKRHQVHNRSASDGLNHKRIKQMD